MGTGMDEESHDRRRRRRPRSRSPEHTDASCHGPIEDTFSNLRAILKEKANG